MILVYMAGILLVLSLTIRTMLYFKSISDYAYLSAEKLHILILLSEIRADGTEALMCQRYRSLYSNWTIVRCYARKINIYHYANQSRLLSLFIAPPPPELRLTLMELESLGEDIFVLSGEERGLLLK